MPTVLRWQTTHLLPRADGRLHSEASCYSVPQLQKAHTLATPNYGYEKRQRELAKKKKKEDKLRAKASGARQDSSAEAPEGSSDSHPDATSPVNDAAGASQQT